MKRILLAIVAFAIGAFAYASPSNAVGHVVEMRNNAYNPPELTVAVGDTVVWHNFDAESHSVVGGAINSPDIAPGGEFSWSFSGPAEISYTCRFHPYMTGVVRATAAGAPAPAPSASPGTTAPASAAPPTTAPPSAGATRPPAALMAVGSETALRPELVAESTPTTVPAQTTTTVATASTVPQSAIGVADDSSSNTGVWLLGLAVVIAVAGLAGVRALRKNVSP